MTFEIIISTTKRELIQAFAALDAWFDDDDLHRYDRFGKWNTIQLLEHIVNINREMIVLMDKPATVEVKEYSYDYLGDFAIDESYIMELQEEPGAPVGRSEHEICAELRWQLYQCLFKLKELEQLATNKAALRSGASQGTLFYFIYFLVEHVKRHLELYDGVEKKEYDKQLH